MKTIRVNRQRLLDQLKENRTKHIELFEASRIEYFKVLEEEIKTLLKKVKSGQEVSQIKTVKPVSYVETYDLEISKLEWSVDDEIELDSVTFDAMINDRWAWKNQFVTLTSSYVK